MRKFSAFVVWFEPALTWSLSIDVTILTAVVEANRRVTSTPDLYGGWLTKGKRTRRPTDKDGNKMVVHQRPRGKEKREGGRRS